MTRSAVAEVVARATGRAVAGIGRLQGGISNLTYLVRLRDGDPSAVVARVFEDPERAHREAAALRILARRDMPAPRLLGLHALSGHRRVLIETRVPGRPVARPHDPDWLGTLAAALADVHSLVPPEPGLAIDPGGDRAWLDDAPHAPLGPAARMIWPALGRRRHELATGHPVLTHGDFHAGNVHWSRGRLAAVLDWEMACWAPAAADVAYCYMDLALASSIRLADRFRTSYASLAGDPAGFHAWLLMALLRPLPDPAAWLPGYEAAGWRGLTPERLRRRHANLTRRSAKVPVGC